MAWSPCGQYLVTISKDHCIRVYEPRASSEPIKVQKHEKGEGGPIFLVGRREDGEDAFLLCYRYTHDLQEGEGPEGSRGARLVWLDKERIVVSGFNKLSEPQ